MLVGQENLSSEYFIGQQDQSIDWTSSIIVEDVVDAKEISDVKVERSCEDFEDKVHLTINEEEHLLIDYGQLLLNIIKSNWPNAFPDLVVTRIRHQYSREFENEVKIWTGPLICENESTLDGMSKIITSLTDELCPVTFDKQGGKIPISPTTFSGDQKTEKASRSAQMALMDNGNMRDKLAFIEGRHELLHLMFMLTDVVLDIFADHQNLEEASSLSRLIKLLNPRLENKKGKDAFYAFRDVFGDIFVAQLEQSLCRYLGVPNLDSDVTPSNIKLEPVQANKMDLLRNMIRAFIRETHAEYTSCEEDSSEKPPLPLYYPHEKYLRERVTKEPIAVIEASDSDEESGSLIDDTTEGNVEEKIDEKNEYFKALFSVLGSFQLLLDGVKEGNSLNCYLIQKRLLKIVQATGHKNYSCSLLAFKNTVLHHSNPQFSHRYLWNIFAGRAGKSLNFPRDMKNEHVNRFLKTAFRSLGVNLNEKTAKRINNSADLGMQIENKVNDFFDIDVAGKSHTKKNRDAQIKKLTEIFKKEKCTNEIPGRVFKGPQVVSDVYKMFDEAKYRVWYMNKEKELLKFQKLRENFFLTEL